MSGCGAGGSSSSIRPPPNDSFRRSALCKPPAFFSLASNNFLAPQSADTYSACAWPKYNRVALRNERRNLVDGFAQTFATAIQHGIDFSRINNDLERGIQELLSHPKYRPDSRIWMTGSGDSLYAAMAVLPGLERWAGFHGNALTAIEFSRYRSPLLTEHDMLWAISNSGSAARTRETVGVAHDKKILTVGVTGCRTGPLAASTDVTLLRQWEELREIDAERKRNFPQHG